MQHDIGSGKIGIDSK